MGSLNNLQKLTGAQKIEIAIQLSEIARKSALAKIKAEYSGATKEEIHKLFLKRFYNET